jgi:hypothetical protein
MTTNKKTAKMKTQTMKACTILFATGLLSTIPAQIAAQTSFAVEGRAGVTLPQGDLADAGAESGLTLGAELLATFRPNLTAYLGLHRHAFSCDGACLLGSSPTSTGIGAGLKYIFHSPGDAHVWGRGGLVANVLGSDDGSSDRKIGFEAGFGADMPIAHRLSLVPNVGYLSHDAGGDFTASFFTLGVGLHYHLN